MMVVMCFVNLLGIFTKEKTICLAQRVRALSRQSQERRWTQSAEVALEEGGGDFIWRGLSSMGGGWYVSCMRGVRTSRGISISDENVRLGVSLVKKNTNKLALWGLFPPGIWKWGKRVVLRLWMKLAWWNPSKSEVTNWGESRSIQEYSTDLPILHYGCHPSKLESLITPSDLKWFSQNCNLWEILIKPILSGEFSSILWTNSIIKVCVL